MQVEREDVEHIEVLAFVFVNALCLDIEERGRINRYAAPLLD